LEVRYPSPSCKHSPNGAHYYLVLSGNIWRCHYCWAPVWLPKDYSTAANFGYNIDRMGLQKAYSRSLSRRPKTAMIIVKLEKVRLLRSTMEEVDFLRTVASIISGKEFEVALVEDNTAPSGKVPPSSRKLASYEGYQLTTEELAALEEFSK